MNELAYPRNPDFHRGPLELGAFYQTIFALPDFAVYIIRVEPDGSFIFEDANEGVAQLAHRPLYDVLGTSPAEALRVELAECLETHLKQCVENARALTYERTLELEGMTMSWKTTLTPVARGFGRISHIIGLTRDISFEKKMAGLVAHNQALLQGLDTAMPNAIYLFNIKTLGLRFIGGNVSPDRREWRRHAEQAGARAVELFSHPEDAPRLHGRVADLAALKDGEVFSINVRVLTREGIYREHVFRETVFSRDAEGEVEMVIGVSEDIADHERAREEVRQLSDRLLTLQMDERRRIAEELHDSTAQHLTGASLALTRLSAPGSIDPALYDVLADARASLEEATREIRVISYLLHPPLIESQGLGDAVRSFATGFGSRAGLTMDVAVDAKAREVGDETALHLFRICQEALANVHRHANATRASVSLEVGEEAVTLTVSDNGIGFDANAVESQATQGVGLQGMRERMKRLGGSLEFSDRDLGTTLIARAPHLA